MKSEDVKPLGPALAIPILAASPEAVTAVAATVVGLEIAEDDIKEFLGIEDQKPNVMETPVIDIQPEDVNPDGSEIAHS